MFTKIKNNLHKIVPVLIVGIAVGLFFGGTIKDATATWVNRLILMDSNSVDIATTSTTSGTPALVINNSNDFYLDVARGKYENVSFIQKFGEASDIDSGEGYVDIWDGVGDVSEINDYTYSTSSIIDSISSTDGGDNQDIVVIGLDGDYEYVEQTATLNGQTRVALSTPLLRVFRAYNDGSTDIAGSVYIYENTPLSSGKPSNTNLIRAIINNGNNQTLMALYTVPAGKTGYVIKGYGSLSRKLSALSNVRYFIRPVGKVFRLGASLVINSAGSSLLDYEYMIPQPLPEKTDIAVRADSDSNDAGVSATFEIILFDNQ